MFISEICIIILICRNLGSVGSVKLRIKYPLSDGEVDWFPVPNCGGLIAGNGWWNSIKSFWGMDRF